MISIFYPPYSFGGDAVFVQRLSEELARRGHEVDVIHCLDSYRFLRKGRRSGAPVEAPGVTVHRLESGVGPLAPLAAHQLGRPALNGRSIERILAAKPFDVIHYHNVSLFGPETLELGAAGVKLYTAHDHWLVCPMSVLWKNRERVCDKPECLSCTLRSGRPPQWWRRGELLARAAEAVDVFFAPSAFCARMHAERGFSREMERLEYFLPPPDEAAEASAEPPHPRPYFLYVGRLEKYKGVQDLFEHFRGPGDSDLVIVGAGAYERTLRQAARDLPRVRFAGWVDQRDLGRYYRHALATVAPSLTYETFGMVLIEAFARGTPVVVRDRGALPEVARDGGAVFRNSAELGAILEGLYADPDLRRRMGANGARAYRERWTPNAHLERYLGVIERAQGRRTQSRSA